jgi:hypothetical protein
MKSVAKHWRLTGVLLVCVLTTTLAAAQSITPSNGGPVNSPIVVVNNGPNDQTEPHVNGSLASYTDFSSGSGRVRYFNFLTNTDAAIPIGVGEQDTLSNTDGVRISLSRQESDRRAIFVFDTTTAILTEVDPQPWSFRFSSAIAGNRVAFLSSSSGTNGDIVLHDFATNTTTTLSSGSFNDNPSIAPDGNTVVWERCDLNFIDCDVEAALWNSALSSWSVFTVSDTLSDELNPDTDGTWIVYESNRPSATGSDIYFKPVNGDSIERHLIIAGDQRYPRVSHGVISFESKATAVDPAGLFIYVIATNTLYQVTPTTPTIDVHLSHVSVLSNGDIRLVWAANDGPGGEDNIYATTFTPPAAAPQYDVCLLYDPLVAKKAGSAYLIKLQLCDSAGNNLSSASIPVHAVSVTRVSNNAPGPLDDTGNANPDFDFRYDSTLQGYAFNLSLRCAGGSCFSTGTYVLNFTAGADPSVHVAAFAVK